MRGSPVSLIDISRDFLERSIAIAHYRYDPARLIACCGFAGGARRVTTILFWCHLTVRHWQVTRQALGEDETLPKPEPVPSFQLVESAACPPAVLNFCSMITKLLQIAALIGVVTPASGQGIARPDVPDKIKAPAGEEVVLQVRATGSQIYVCQPGTDGKLAWTLKAPEAELHDQQGKIVGRHYAGPAWKANDGSEVTGKAAARVESPDPDSIPWLLVSVTGHSGEGVLSRVTSIQRVHTKSGLPPPAAECNPAKQNVEVKSAYTADYYFYAPPK